MKKILDTMARGCLLIIVGVVPQNCFGMLDMRDRPMLWSVGHRDAAHHPKHAKHISRGRTRTERVAEKHYGARPRRYKTAPKQGYARRPRKTRAVERKKSMGRSRALYREQYL